MNSSYLTTVKALNREEIKVYDANYDNSQIDQEGFLRVLLASFQYQDPFEAQDISKFIDNTVKLRQLEVMKGFEDSVSKLSGNDALFISATNMIGKKVIYEGSQTYIENGKSEVAFTPKEDAVSATVYIYDAENNIVAQKEFKEVKAGQKYRFAIDDASIPEGYYTVSVVAKRGTEDIPTTTYATARITGIQKEQGSLIATFEKGAIEISKIDQIGV